MNEQYVYGLHAVSALLANPHRMIKKLFVNQDRIDKRLHEFLVKAESAHVPIEKLSAQKMNQQFPEFTHQGLLHLLRHYPNTVKVI